MTTLSNIKPGDVIEVFLNDRIHSATVTLRHGDNVKVKVITDPGKKESLVFWTPIEYTVTKG